MKTVKKLVPPDGGWGWVVVFANALTNVIAFPLMQGFGLIFQETFSRLNMSATDAAVIINLNSAFGMIMGLLNGPLLRRFGFRKVGLVGASLLTGGVFLTAFANSFTQFMITYGIISSYGFYLVMSSFSLALNSYFKVFRNKAAGIAWTITGLGPVLFPQLISFLLSKYGTTGCVLVLTALISHSILAALLLQPIKWHMKEAPEVDAKALEKIDEGDEENEDAMYSAVPISRDGEFKLSTNKIDKAPKRLSIIDGSVWDLYKSDDDEDYLDNGLRKRSNTLVSIDPDNTQLIYGTDAFPRSRRGSETQLDNKLPRSRRTSLNKSHHGSSAKIIEENIHAPLTLTEENDENGSDETFNEEEKEMINGITPEIVKIKNKGLKRAAVGIVKFFDLDLLRDPVYVSLMIGMSVAIFAEINFSLLTPFILKDMNFTTQQIATVMSSLAITDIICRFCAPFIGDYFKQTPRMMYMYSLIMLIITRSTVLLANSFVTMLLVGLGLGVAKGIRTVYMNLVIPTYVPIERLASASGIQSVVNGLILIGVGPILGVIRDITGSYKMCIIMINAVTAVTLIMWTVEIQVTNFKERRRQKELPTV